jgi:hypothetical protein
VANSHDHRDVEVETDSAGVIEIKVDPSPLNWTSIEIYVVRYRDA